MDDSRRLCEAKKSDVEPICGNRPTVASQSYLTNSVATPCGASDLRKQAFSGGTRLLGEKMRSGKKMGANLKGRQEE